MSAPKKAIVCASALVLSADGKVVLCERKDQPGRWGRPTGKVQPQESLLEAAIRETREETGLSLTTMGVRDLALVYAAAWPAEEAPPGVDGHTTVYLARLNATADRLPLRPAEGEGAAAWFVQRVLANRDVNPFFLFDQGLLAAVAPLLTPGGTP